MLRRSALAVAVTVILLIGGGALAHALWSAREPMPDVRITAGDFDATATWVDEPALVGLFPGDTVDGAAQVRLDSSASWEFSVELAAGGPLGPYLELAWQPACAGPFLAPGARSGTPLPGDSTADLCLELSLSEDTPSQLQGQAGEVEVVVTVEQVR
ncbi:MAG: hypothetical protein ACTHW7_13960 [Actinomycetaceae bacterium]